MFDFLTPSIISLLINGCLIILALTLLYTIVLMIGGSSIFLRAKKNKTTAYYPIINLFGILEIVDMSSFWGILFFIPILNLVALAIMSYKLGTVFNTSFKFKMGLIFLPICFYPLLSYSDYKYKISDEEYFKALDSAKGESINLLTDEEIKEQNTMEEEEENNVDSVFKSDIKLKEQVTPYKAQKVDVLEPTKEETIEMENPFKPIELVQPEKKEEQKKEEVVKDNKNYVDL